MFCLTDLGRGTLSDMSKIGCQHCPPPAHPFSAIANLVRVIGAKTSSNVTNMTFHKMHQMVLLFVLDWLSKQNSEYPTRSIDQFVFELHLVSTMTNMQKCHDWIWVVRLLRWRGGSELGQSETLRSKQRNFQHSNEIECLHNDGAYLWTT